LFGDQILIHLSWIFEIMIHEIVWFENSGYFFTKDIPI